MNERILMSPPDIGVAEEEAVLRALRSGWVAPTGPEVTQFENEIAARCGVEHAVAMSSGTAALHLAMIHLGIGPGDTVIVPSMTFVASANAVVYTGAAPCFVDSDEDGNLDPDLLEHAISDLLAGGRTVAAVMSVDLLGRCADYSRILDICGRFEIPLIEDAAESLGALHRGRPAGSFGRAAVLSFNGNKIMTTSGGGMLLTDDSAMADHCRSLSTQARQPVRHYEHLEIGFNYRMSNILAAIGRAQLARLNQMIKRRRQIRSRYAEVVASLPGATMFQGSDLESDNCWLSAVILDPTGAPVSADALVDALDVRGIEARPLWKPMHLQPVYREARHYSTGRSEALFRHGVTLPSGSVHGPDTIDRVVAALEEAWTA